jgi:glycosyltransferase involved in cell wall biosynthesis
MRFILIAHGLIGRTGHHYMEARAFKEEAAKHGLECTILAHRNITPSIRDELGARPLFRFSPYDRPVQQRRIGPLINFPIYAQSMKKQLMSLPPETITASDIMVSTLTRANEMLGFVLWLAQRPREQRPFLAINFMIDDITRPLPGTSRWTVQLISTMLYRFSFTLLRKKLPKDRLLLSAGGDAFARTMSRVLKHPVQSFPLPVQHELPSVEPALLSPGRAPLIVYLGHTQPRKGSDLAGEVVRGVLEQHANCRFLLQANPECWEKRWRDVIGPVGKDRVLIHRGEMNQEEFQNAIGSSDLVLLPYRPERYALQTSGVFSEAMALGKASIVPEGTWMADMARRHGGGAVLFHRHEVGAIVKAGLKALEILPQLTADARRISTVWRETMGMKAFVQRILDAAERPGKTSNSQPGG